MVKLFLKASLQCNGHLSLVCSWAGEMLVAVKLDELGSLLQRMPALLERIQTWGSKLINCPSSPLTSNLLCGAAHPHPQGASELPPPSLPCQGRGTMGDKKEKANKACFEQKDKEAKPQMKHYHFKGVKK